MGRQYPDAKTQEEVACASGGAEEARGEALVGVRIEVWWKRPRKWYAGVVDRYDVDEDIHRIHYDDNDEQWEKLGKLGEGWRRLAPAPAPAPAAPAKLPQHLRVKTQEVACASGGAEEARGEALMGARIAVWWEGDCTWYKGVVVAAAPCTACGDPVYHHAAGHSHHILYDDNAEQWETLDKLGKGWRLLAPAPAPAHGGIHSVRPGAPPAPPAPPAPLGGLSDDDDGDDDVSCSDASEIEIDLPEPLLPWQQELLELLCSRSSPSSIGWWW